MHNINLNNYNDINFMLRNANTILLFIEKIDHIFIMTTRNTARLKLPKHKADLFMTQLG